MEVLATRWRPQAMSAMNRSRCHWILSRGSRWDEMIRRSAASPSVRQLHYRRQHVGVPHDPGAVSGARRVFNQRRASRDVATALAVARFALKLARQKEEDLPP